MQPATIIGWTGKGRLSDLRESALGSLVAGHARGVRLKTVGVSLVCSGADLAVVSRTIANLPGVGWVALGFEVSNGLQGFTKAASVLARRYLSPGTTFAVSAAAATSNQSEGDMILAVSSTILSRVRGTHVQETKPKVRFRISFSGSVGACGVQIREGVGGVPTSRRRIAHCLASGGRHSSVAAWMAALSGFSVRLVHVRVDDASLREVAKLYSELSHRMDPSRLSLHIVEGRGVAAQTLSSWLGSSKGLHVVVGAHLECDREAMNYASSAPPGILFPVMLLQEEDLREVYQALGMKEIDGVPSGILGVKSKGDVRYRVKQFKGERVEMHAILDSLVN